VTDPETATVRLADGREFEVFVQRAIRCRTHGGQPGWGCNEGCDFAFKAIVGFMPIAGWLS